MKILVVDDEVQLRRLLKVTLESDGYDVVLAETGNEGITRAAMENPVAVILDLALPDIDGMTVLNRLREWTKIPIIILSVRDAEEDIIRALDAGADDYLVKPFRGGELLARLRTAIRRGQGTDEESVLKIGALMIDLAAHLVQKNHEPVHLTSTEFSLLNYFVNNRGKVLTHRQILAKVWGPAYVDETQYTRVYVAQLRKKLEDDPANPRLFLSESGIGYRFAPEG